MHYLHQKLPDDIIKVPLSVLGTYPASMPAQLAQKARTVPTAEPQAVQSSQE